MERNINIEILGITEKPQATILIDKFSGLQQIKLAKDKEKEIDYQLKNTKAKLKTLGIATEDLIDNIPASDKRLEILHYYLNNPTNNGQYSVDDIKKMEGKIIDTHMNDLRIYDGKCPTLRAQRNGILYVHDGIIYQLTGYEALLLQGFPKEYADKVKNIVSDRHLLMQAGNAMTVNVIKALGNSMIGFLKKYNYTGGF